MKRFMRLLLVCAAISALALLGLLAWSTNNASRLEQYYPLLLTLNTVVAVGLGAWVLTLAARLIRQLRRHQFGARLTARLALAFALVGVVPGVIIYTLSVEFLSRSIESWFNVRVNAALDAGLDLGRAALDSRLADLNDKARTMALELAELPDPNETSLTLALTRLRERLAVAEAMVFTGSGNVVAFSTGNYSLLAPALPPTTLMQQVRTGRSYSATEPASTDPADNDPSLNLRVILPLASLSTIGDLNTLIRPETRYLQLMQPVPAQIAANANQVQTGYRDYQELALSRLGLRKLYGITLTLALLLAAFTAIVAAFALSSRLVRPLLRLAAGTQAVSVGDFRQIPEPPSRDEVGQLTRSFNAMTRQLAEAGRMVAANRLQLERSNAYLENVLATLSSGVLVFDEAFRVTTVNQGAQRILGADLRTVVGRPLETLGQLTGLAHTIRQAFAEHTASASGRQHWQKQVEINPQGAPDAPPEPFSHQQGAKAPVILLARGSHLVVDGAAGYVVVFDDITDVISANRIVAWGEVARRLAHEIKNPLTPIQLSAERLLFKLEGKLAEPEAALLRRATTTIVNQVASMQAMVNDFRDYARTPSPSLADTDLNAIVSDVLALYGWDPVHAPHGAGDGARLNVSLAEALPRIWCDQTQLRQIVLNLIANAQDAVAGNDASRAPLISVGTRLASARLADGTALAAVQLRVMDNGPGFSESVLQRAFEPYVTTKPKGTGLGLAIVKKIVEEHGGRIEISNRPDGGAHVSILLTRLVSPEVSDPANVLQDRPVSASLHE
ncbi:HAMP domain-containing protein [Verticiella sediminum]|uniref:histidine kinase n=1 Tax=Verticiella sediminum TaxID=1247510 RepID=A0A556AMQ2_9BURK|nr:ATP-binding protein [Verticiella sediminum]TSH94145.1 HAMP domain-containing protein [Verticiella sediminum]